MMDGLQITIPRRMQMARVAVVLSLLISMWISYPLWAGSRIFPLSPLIDTSVILPPYDVIYIVLLSVFLVCSLVLKIGRVMLALALGMACWLVLMDLSRLQPWFIIYNALIFVFIFYNGRVDDSNKFTSFFILLQLVVAAAYLYTGFSFLFLRDAGEEFTSIIHPLRSIISARQFELFANLGVTVPYLLCFIGLGLIISPVRYLAITLAILMHLLLIFFLFPSKQWQNYPLWFSNLSFLVLLVLLFSGKTKQRYYSPTFLLQQPVFYLLLIVFGFFILAPLRISGDFSVSLSFSSQPDQKNRIRLGSGAMVNMDPYVQSITIPDPPYFRLDHGRWCLRELKSGFIAHPLVIENLTYYLKKKAGTGVKEVELLDAGSAAVLLKREGSFIFASNSENR